MSFHHWMYFGCQCSSARCKRLLLESPTLFGIRSAEIMACSAAVSVWVLSSVAKNWWLRPVEIELRPRLRSVGRQRALGADGVGPDEDPVLPRGQPAEDLRLHRLGSGEAQVRLHPGERVGRQRRA